MASDNSVKHAEAHTHHELALGAADDLRSKSLVNGDYQKADAAMKFHTKMRDAHLPKMKTNYDSLKAASSYRNKYSGHEAAHELIGKPHPADSLLKDEIYKSEDKIYTDPVEILDALREGAKKMIADHLEKTKKLEKGDTSPIPPDDVGMPQPTLAKVAIKLDNNKNSGLPRGNYTGKTSIMKPESAPKPLAPPKALSAPKPPQAPMPPKPPMAKGEGTTGGTEYHVMRSDGKTKSSIGSFPSRAAAETHAGGEDMASDIYSHHVEARPKVISAKPNLAKGELGKHAADGDDGVILTDSTKHVSKESADKFADALKSGKIHHIKEQTAKAPSKQPDHIDRIMGDMRAARVRVAPKDMPKPVAEPKSKMRMEHGLELDKAEDNPQKLKKEHLGFEKLEGKLAHEKGVTDPKALAAKIGMEKYGKKGMEAQAESAKKSESLTKDEKESNPNLKSMSNHAFSLTDKAQKSKDDADHVEAYKTHHKVAQKFDESGQHETANTHRYIGDVHKFIINNPKHKDMIHIGTPTSSSPFKKAEKSESLTKDEATKNMRPPKITGTEKTVISKPSATKKPSPLENFGNGLKQGADKTIVVDKSVSMRKHEVASEQKNPIKEMKEAVKEMKSNVEKLPVKEKKTPLKKDEIQKGEKDKVDNSSKHAIAYAHHKAAADLAHKSLGAGHAVANNHKNLAAAHKKHINPENFDSQVKRGTDIIKDPELSSLTGNRKNLVGYPHPYDALLENIKKSLDVPSLTKDEVHIHMGGKDKASKMMTSQALDQAHKDVKQTAMVPDKGVKLPNQKEQAVRAQQYASMTPKGHFDDDILGSCGYCGKSEHDGMC